MIESDKILEKLNAVSKDTLMGHLSIEYIEVGDHFLVARMPVNNTTRQPMGILHGGAALALSESVGSALSAISIDLLHFDVKGMEINANHIRSVKDGYVTAYAKFLHKGKLTHIVEIKVLNQHSKLVTICRLTNVIIEK